MSHEFDREDNQKLTEAAAEPSSSESEPIFRQTKAPAASKRQLTTF